ncbi:FOG: TPR repeat, SEL1 subfamily [Hahella chejuensis KCTC 2396]|uniref:FOG: TPR repeat, SEL1 subfamily n=1 Tax=Hahella chejuensis (strain KCTC 2396) TaxID=349521 RepID=Q2S846_HAHCH|nr:SEL1-like repeat protein [Hahella chejuensis]ABC33178.1 FOG: TPR repeat, SEL1 subfamily [Hahella chejuensis KCTC 2396]
MKKHYLAGLLCGLLISGAGWRSACAATPEELFNSGQYDEFFSQARDAAAKGDADALFLLGKAHDLGKGVNEDREQARAFYQQAREKGSARASHNLGVMEIDAGRPKAAIPLLQEALERGLKMPTYINFAVAYNEPDPTSVFAVAGVLPNILKSGDYYAQAHELKPDAGYDFEASRQYVRAYQMSRHLLPGERDSFDSSAMRKQAVEWLQKGMDRGLRQAWTNYGVLMLDEKNYVEAQSAFSKSAAQDEPVAHYHLARIAEMGWGQEERNREQALIHYEKASLSGLEAARQPARNLLEEELRYETDIDKLEQGLKRLEALRKPDDYNYVSLNSPEARLIWGKFLRDQKRTAQPLPALPIVLKACGLGFSQPHGEQFNIGENSSWRLEAHKALGEVEPLSFSGLVNAEGCAELDQEMPANVRALLNEGAVLALRFPNYSLPLQWKQEAKNILLDMQPIGAPLPSGS